MRDTYAGQNGDAHVVPPADLDTLSRLENAVELITAADRVAENYSRINKAHILDLAGISDALEPVICVMSKPDGVYLNNDEMFALIELSHSARDAEDEIKAIGYEALAGIAPTPDYDRVEHGVRELTPGYDDLPSIKRLFTPQQEFGSLVIGNGG